MNLFRSEEHVRRWSRFREDAADGTVNLEQAALMSAAGLYRERLAPDYLDRRSGLAEAFVATFERIGKTGPYWLPSDR